MMAKPETAAAMLEQYRDFYDSGAFSNPSRHLLNHILYMHGFVRRHHSHKMKLMELVDSIDLMPPRRSTVDDDAVSSLAFLTAAEMESDLAEMGWRECPVRCLRFVHPASAAPRAPPATFIVRGRRPRSKRKRASVNALLSASAAPPLPVPIYHRFPTPLSPPVSDRDDEFGR